MVIKLKIDRSGHHVRATFFTGVDREHLQHSGVVTLGSVGDWQGFGAALTHGCNELRVSGQPLVELIVEDLVLESS